MSVARPIYLDNHAHALLDHRVAKVLANAFSSLDANPHSIHIPGQAAHQALETAREQVAALIDCAAGEIVFTSGATEANNLALLGLAQHCAAKGRPRILVGAGEHPSVLAAADGAVGGQAERVPLLPTGKIDLSALESMLGQDVGIVSIAAANHEIGSIQDLELIAERVHAIGGLFHSDLAQAAAWLPIRAGLFDLASLSAHKIGGPIGVGALFIRRRHRRHLSARSYGGGQEQGARAGTVPVPLCVAFGAACDLIAAEREQTASRVSELRDMLFARLESVGGLTINGGGHRLPGNLNLSFDGVDGEALVLRLRNCVSASTGSACTSRSLTPSHVLKAIGLSDQRAEQAVRFGLGKGTTAEQIEQASDAIVAAIHGLRSINRRVA